MAKFSYTAKTKEGRPERGTEEANTREEFVARLRSRGLFIVSINEIKQKSDKPPVIPFIFHRKGKRHSIKIYDLALFARNLFTTLSSGVTLLRSLEIIAHQTESARLDKVLRECSKSVKEGLSLSEAIAKYPFVFPALWRGVVEVGETSGNLPFVMEKLAEYLEMRMEFERKVKSALVYPSIVLFAALIAVFVFLKFILPKFSTIFDQFGIELPLLTKIMFGASSIVEKYWLIIFGVMAIIIFTIAKTLKNPETRKAWDRIGLRAPIMGDLIFLACLERFTSAVSILLDSGLPLVSTLEVAARATGNSFLEKNLIYVRDRVRDGGSLSGEFTKQELFPPLISEMSRIGEETGTLPQVFGRISVHYRKELSTTIDRLVSAFEPLMIVFMGVIIGFIVISLFLPLFKLSTLGGQGIPAT
ncbi:MAG: type II secretion system F family protein [Candidatus Omnitrophota bacterium]|nr:type II secretion system F family protein [Candidatus Omnitrophota bacterium]